MTQDQPKALNSTVLVIEDSSSQRALIAYLLERLGYTAVTASNGKDGLRKLWESGADLVLLDVVMPEQDGWETLELIREVSAVPVIMLTSRDSEAERVRGLYGGADDYIGKPFGQQELGARITTVLRRTNAARTDELTSVGNHRAFHEYLESVLRRDDVDDQECTLVIFDLDNFKQINDTRGHPVGDRVLKKVARIALRETRLDEELFRIGGEEFAIVLAGGPEGGERVMDRIRSALEKSQRGLELPTLSAGVATYPRHANSKEELISLSDAATYEAKRAGKDRVVVYKARAAAD